jgi:hypothetical protein
MDEDAVFVIIIFLLVTLIPVIVIPIIIAIIAKNSEKKTAQKNAAQGFTNINQTGMPAYPYPTSVSGIPTAEPQQVSPKNFYSTPSSGVNTAFKYVIQKMVAGRGFYVFENYAKCKSLLQDYTAGEYKKESRLLLLAVEAGCPGEIIRSADPEITRKKLINRLHDEFSMEYTAAEQVIGLLYEVIPGI